MSGAPIKRSLTLRGHRTSVSLEDMFWHSLKEISSEQGKAINALAAEIDAERDLETGLATAIRLYILAHYKTKASGVSNPPAND